MTISKRPDARIPTDLRPLSFELGLQRNAAGSVLVRQGNTHVLCTVMVEEKVPAHRMASGGGWLTAEYAMMPGATAERQRRERHAVRGALAARAQQRVQQRPPRGRAGRGAEAGL